MKKNKDDKRLGEKKMAADVGSGACRLEHQNLDLEDRLQKFEYHKREIISHSVNR